MIDEKRFGERVTTLDRLHNLAMQKRSVVSRTGMCAHRPLPAGFVLNQQGGVLFNIFNRGLFLYMKPEEVPE